MARLTLSFLGPFQAELDGHPITSFESNKVRALLAYLAVEASHLHPRGVLAGLLWPDWPERSARSNLRYALSNLRKAIGDRDADLPFLHISRSALQFNMDADVALDVRDFERLVEAGTAATGAGAGGLEQAIRLYRGPFLDGFSVPDAGPFEEWARSIREVLSRRLSEGFGALAAVLEAQGDLSAVSDCARRWVDADRVNEAAYRCLMRALALQGDRTAALTQYEACCRVLREDLDVLPSQETIALRDAIREERLVLERGSEPTADAPAPGPPPFRGLRYFDVADAGLFYGRESLTADLMARLEKSSFLAVIGASGSGKSSLVRAGLIPALRQDASIRRQIHLITPTEHPLSALAVSLTSEPDSISQTSGLLDDLMGDPRTLSLYAQWLAAKSGSGPGELLLVVDQFEELFTLCQDPEERRAFVENLLEAVSGSPRGALVSVIALRADFYSHCGQYAGLRDLLAEHQVYVGPMCADELRRAIEEPARQGGWAIEPGLVDLILRDVGEEPGRLPLLSHALLETWQRREGRSLTLAGYQNAGGVRGAIANTAESIYQGLGPNQREIAKRIYVRLTELGEGTEDTRRRASLTEILSMVPSETDVRNVVDVLVDARLITVERETVEVAHEALIREWPTLRAWLDADREGLRLHRHLAASALEWEELGRDPSELYRGARLAQAQEWAMDHPDLLTSIERAFLTASEAEAKRAEAEREAQRQRELVAAQQIAAAEAQRAAEQASAAQRLRRRLAYLVSALILACGLGVLAVLSRRAALKSAGLAQAQLEVAEAQRRLAVSRELAAAALDALRVDPERGVLLNLYALEYAHTPEAINALHTTVRALRPVQMLDHGQAPDSVVSGYSPQSILYQGVYDVAFRPTGDPELLATSYGVGSVGFWDVMTGHLIESHRLDRYQHYRVHLAFSPNGTELALTTKLRRAGVWQVGPTIPQPYTTSNRDLFGQEGTITAIGYSPDGSRLVSGTDGGELGISDAVTGEHLMIVRGRMGAAQATNVGVTDAAFSPDGKVVVAAYTDGAVSIWDAETGEESVSLNLLPAEVSAVAFGPGTEQARGRDDAHLLAAASVDGRLELHDISVSIPDASLRFEVDTGTPINDVVFSADGRYLALGSDSGATIWNVALERRVLVLRGHAGSVRSVAFSPDGTRLATSGEDNTVGLWDISPGNRLLTLPDVPGHATAVLFGPGCGSVDCVPRLVGANDLGDVYVWDADTGHAQLELTAHSKPVSQVALGPDGRLLATAGQDRAVRLWDVERGALALEIGGYESFSAVTFSPDGDCLAVGSAWGVVQVWDANEPTQRWQVRVDRHRIPGLQFDERGQRIVVGTENRFLNVLDAASGARIDADLMQTLSYGAEYAVDYAFSGDGNHVLVAGADGKAEIWEIVSGELELVSALETGTGRVLSVAYSPDGSQVATGGHDGMTKVWDVVASIEAGSGVEVLSLGDAGSRIVDVGFSADGRRLATASHDGTVRTYLLSLDEMITLAHQRVKRGLTEEECRKFLKLDTCPQLH